MLAETCIVEPRNEEPIEGFQRALDQKRAQDIANYIDNGFGTIPSSIVLSAQPDSELLYRRINRTVSFRKTPKSFLILDGQHRVFGFILAQSTLRVPVVIYNNLTRTEECRLFMDINTKQRPVPNELLLDIKRLAATESSSEGLFRDVFDLFDKDQTGPLFGLMSPSERSKGKISRVTFNNALKPVADALTDASPEYVYGVLSSYIQACVAGLRIHGLSELVTNSTMLRALFLLFPTIAERVADRHADDYSVKNFSEIIDPLFNRLKKSELQKPGASYLTLHDSFRKALRTGFSIGKGKAS